MIFSSWVLDLLLRSFIWCGIKNSSSIHQELPAAAVLGAATAANPDAAELPRPAEPGPPGAEAAADGPAPAEGRTDAQESEADVPKTDVRTKSAKHGGFA